MSIIGAEDEDFENDLNEYVEDRSNTFNHIEQLKSRPTHLLVFLQHVILQFDPAPLLCYLHAELFKNLSAKETKKQFGDFYTTFLDKGAVLKVAVPAHVNSELDRSRLDVLTDDIQKRFVQDIQSVQVAEVAKQLEDFRQKRMMGMTLSEAELNDVDSHYPTDRVPTDMKEKSVAENLLEKMSETQSTGAFDEDKCQTIFNAVVLYMKHLGVKNKAADSKKSKGGFFTRKTKPKIKDDIPKAKSSRVFPVLPNWMVTVESKIKVDEADRDRGSVDRKGPGAKTTPNDSGVPTISLNKKQSLIPPVQPAVDVDSPSNNATSTTTIESHSDAVPSNRLELPTLQDDLPSGPAGGLIEPISPILPSDIPPEEPVEKESPEGLSFAPEPGHSPTSPFPQVEEVDPRLQEFESDPPNWRELASPEALSRLTKKETKMQEVINELFTTEHAHVRMLSVLQVIFVRPLEREELLTSTELAAVFPNLDEITEMHSNFYESLKKQRLDNNFIVKSISTTVLNRFGGTEGEWFQKLTARFCSHQSWALDQIKTRQKRDPRFNIFIQEAESKPQCRRLQLKDIIPIEMQRLTKYPLLLENIAKNTEDLTEKAAIEKSAECCRKILNHVNEEVKVMENLLTLREYQRKLDTSGLKPSNELYSEYRNIDLTQKKMLYEGPLIWKVTKEKAVEVQCVLLADLLVLLQKQDDKMVVKCHSKSNIAAQDGKLMLSPIIKLDSVFLRDVATDRKAFYVIFTWESGAQIYELVAQSVGEVKIWTQVIKKAVDDLKKSGSTTKKLTVAPGVGVVGPPFSPISLNPPMSPIENGALKSSSDQDKDNLKDKKSTDPRHRLIDFLSDKGFDLIGHTKNDQEKVANSALDEVMSLKRLLVGSISLSEDSQPDEENEVGQSKGPGQDVEQHQLTDESQTTNEVAEETNRTSTDKEGQNPKGDDESISAPLVLSQERKEEVCRRLRSLEEQLKRLQTVEEEHHKLQEALSKFSLEGGSF
ncbi:rho guanine nucleotide exchange factor 1b isoform X7 [Simochromis diagramma]|uniref:rho guanine nucleotide exchange factor 1b isoform X7 n=1 Tax=Simochromis diagramma TaxID=43689 RepID=UPI001A7F0497|nr:rho guanine nucleotide exchange factor 1b isoform X7 [Simochromis diagramma]